MELESSENAPGNAAEILQSLSECIYIAKYPNEFESSMDDEWTEMTDAISSLELASSIEPLYESFFCPLANKIMDDPVTIETGVTYERAVITEWFEKFTNPADIFCPQTGRKITSRVLNRNITLMEIIKQWKERNEQARIMAARSALSLGSTKTMILEALHNLQSLCRNKQYSVVQVRTIGVLPLLGTILEHEDRDVTFKTLQLLRQLVENDDDEGKKTISRTIDLSAILRNLSSNFECVRHSALLLLLELSESRYFCVKFGLVTGGVFMLITVKYRWHVDAFASEKVDQILKNLEVSPSNIKCMAENGHWQPLLHHLLEAETASPALIQMVSHGDSLARNVAFKALKQISFHHNNGKVLVKAGTASTMLHEMFKRTIYDEPMKSKAEAAAILANTLESGSTELNDLQVGHKMSLIELVNNPNEELQVSSIMFSIALSPFLGHTLAERLCKTRGQPQALLKELPETIPPTKKQAVSVNFLSKLPHENLTLNMALLNMDTVPLVLREIDRVQKSGMRMSKYGSAYLEGLVGILVRFTATLYEFQILVLARNCSFTTVFTELLMNTSSDEVQRLSAIGLENLSSKTVILSKPPLIKKPRFRISPYLQKCFSFDSKKSQSRPLCPVHKGTCSSQETFCLLEAKAVEKLLACFDHKNIQVVEAALSAICTLLDERLDLDISVSMLIQEKAIEHVLNMVKEHKDESLRQKSFWILEQVLMKGGENSPSEISKDRFLHATLINVLHHGHGDIRLSAEKILRHLNKMPNFSANFTM